MLTYRSVINNSEIVSILVTVAIVGSGTSVPLKYDRVLRRLSGSGHAVHGRVLPANFNDGPGEAFPSVLIPPLPVWTAYDPDAQAQWRGHSFLPRNAIVGERKKIWKNTLLDELKSGRGL